MTELSAGPQAETGFAAVLTPHRSLSPKGFTVLMALVCLVSFATGLLFYLLGAWPVMGFMGLDVALIYVAFKLNYRAARLYETVDLTPGALTVTTPSARISPKRCRGRCPPTNPLTRRSAQAARSRFSATEPSARKR